MNEALLLLVAAALLLVAGTGAFSPLISRRAPEIEPPPDPFQERRVGLVRAIKDLEVAWDAGDLEEQEYQRLRLETESRLVRVLKVIEERSTPDSEQPQRVDGDGRPRIVPKWFAWATICLAILGITVAGIVRSVSPRSEGQTFTGTIQGSEGQSEDLSFFETRVKSNPNDVAARLDLGHRYLNAGRTGDAVQQYIGAVDLDPSNAEANAHLGLLLYRGQSPANALKAVDRALKVDPGYPEALFFKGVILLKGLQQPAPAKEAFQAYLDVAATSSERDEARRLLAEAEAALAAPAG